MFGGKPTGTTRIYASSFFMSDEESFHASRLLQK